MRPIDSRRLEEWKRQEILKKYDYKCVYCLLDADEVDHIIPWAYLRDDGYDNLVAACWLCNSIASDHIFDTFDLKRVYILRKRDFYYFKHKIPIWIKSDLNDFSYNLRMKIIAESIVVDDKSEYDHIKNKILEAGLYVR